MKISDNLKVWAKWIKRDGVNSGLQENTGTPWYAKALGLFVKPN
jgi:hypothetical protein